MRRILVTGSRNLTDRRVVFDALDAATANQLPNVLVVHGGAAGADKFADEWAKTRGVARSIFPAQWEHFGTSAGPIRNRLMATEMKPDLVLAFPAEGSRGTWDMVRVARDAGIPCEVHS